MFDWYDQIKMYYDLGIYGADQVQVFVDAGWIRQEQGAKITGRGWEARGGTP